MDIKYEVRSDFIGRIAAIYYAIVGKRVIVTMLRHKGDKVDIHMAFTGGVQVKDIDVLSRVTRNIVESELNLESAREIANQIN